MKKFTIMDVLNKKLSHYNINLNLKVLIEVAIAIMIFIPMVLGTFTLFKIIAFMLSFIVILEVTRMVVDFVLDEKHVIRMRLVIDGFILFLLRDVILVVSDEKYTQLEIQNKLLILVPVIFMFFIFRYFSIKYSPNDKNCATCPAIITSSDNKEVDGFLNINKTINACETCENITSCSCNSKKN